MLCVAAVDGLRVCLIHSFYLAKSTLPYKGRLIVAISNRPAVLGTLVSCILISIAEIHPGTRQRFG